MDKTTSNKPQLIKGGPGMMKGKETGVPFTKDNQPSNEAKKEGQQRKKLLKDVLNAALNPKGEHAKMIAACAEYLEKDAGSVTLADLMHFRQAQKAISKQDTFAYQAVMDRAYGKPENKTTLANDVDNPITPLQPDQVSLFLAEIRKTRE
jgi:hypothetical protein